jgi:DNA polymerase-3 subunit gamma/tau
MSENSNEYRVLARKYRPQNFDDLIGQDALVRTLKNAIESGRIAHAFMLTGIRGVGKTTTARIIAKALNYSVGEDGGKPTTGSTDDCEVCRAIAEDRHPDVMEMDAASRTGIDDIREILDGVRYAPTSARYKIYIIDEVHMLSKSAFNALLKTLEEPPEHVKFIFATTEIRKVPVTVLSRCQRFDLLRVDVPVLADYYKDICEKEGSAFEEEAINLVARAADGSVRDGLSMLDQAIALGDGSVTYEQVKEMLGLADRANILDLLESAAKADTKRALEIMEALYKKGADPVVLLQDMLEFVHLLTKLRAIPDLKKGQNVLAVQEMERVSGLSGEISMPSLGRMWQILLKGIGEVNIAPDAQKAAEMVVIRLSYASDLPDPADLLRKIEVQQSSDGSVGVAVRCGSASGGSSGNMLQQNGERGAAFYGEVSVSANAEVAIIADEANVVLRNMEIVDLRSMVAVLEEAGEVSLASQIYYFVSLVKMSGNSVEINVMDGAMPRISQDISSVLRKITGNAWLVSLSDVKGDLTLSEQDKVMKQQKFDEVLQSPLVSSIVELFPGTKLVNIIDE